MTTPRRYRGFDFGFPWAMSTSRLERTLDLVETSFAEQRERAEELTREVIAGTVTPDRWSDAMRDAYEASWKSYRSWWRIVGARSHHGDRNDDDDDCDEKDD